MVVLPHNQVEIQEYAHGRKQSRAAGNLSAIQGAHGNLGSQLPSTRPNEKALSGQLILLVSVKWLEEERMRSDEEF